VTFETTSPATVTGRKPPLLADLLSRLDDDGVRYCFLRDGHALERLAGGGELDLLVNAADRTRFEQRLRDLDFARLPAWGHAPHRFWVGYDESSDVWLKVDAVDRIAYGRPVRSLVTSLGERCLRNRRKLAAAWVPKPSDELVTLLLHCWLDKGAFADSRRARLGELCGRIDEPAEVDRMLSENGITKIGWERISRLIRAGEWSMLTEEGATAARGLRVHGGARAVARGLRERALRKLARVLRPFRRPALTVALLAPDGAGKSTLSQGIRDRFFLPVRSVYMGLYQKNGGASVIPAMPGIGFVARMARQWTRWIGARWQTAQGRFVIFDRYSYDALLPTGRPGLLARARRWLLAHSCPAPDVVFVLDAPGAVLHARKGEHTPEKLEEQRQRYLALGARLAQSVVVDVTQDLDRVRREITAEIWRRYARGKRGLR
jgi:thymidylate kinase